MSTVTFSGTGELTQSIVNENIGSATIVIIEGYSSIGNDAFNEKTLITSVTIQNSVIIGRDVFRHCSGLTSVIIGSSLTIIDYSAFYDCSALTSIDIPSSITTIDSTAFRKCFSLTSINVNSANTTFSSQDGVLFNKEKTILRVYPGGKNGSYTIPSSVTSIGRDAFFSCVYLASIIIPNIVTSIGANAFYGCSGLTSVTLPTNSSFIIINSSAFSGCSSLTSITIPSSVTSIDDYAFSGCSSLTSITIPSSVTSIGNSAFRNCSGLQTVYVADSQLSTESIGDNFYPIEIIINSPASNVPFFGAIVTTLLPISTPPPAPVITSITTSSQTATINFTQTTNEASAIISYQYSTDSGTTWVTVLQTTSPIIVTGLTNGSTYSFIIRNNNGLYSNNSNTVTVTMSATTTATLIGAGELTKNIIDSIPGISSVSLINISNSYTSISSNAFSACVGDVNITLPSSITNIGATQIQCDGMTIERTSGIVQWRSTQTTKLFSNTGSFVKANTLFA